MIIGLITFTAKGRELGQCLMRTLTATEWRVYAKAAEDAKSWVVREFQACDALVFVGATGIAVRLIAPLLQSKASDPAVLALDEAGRFVIPLISGHIGGANALALQIAELLGAEPVISTATDINGVWAADAWAVQNGCVVANPAHIKHISSALLNGTTVGLHSDFPISGSLPPNVMLMDKGPLGVCVSLDALEKPFDITLNLVPRIVTLGAGCRKDTDISAFEAFVLQTLDRCNVSVGALKKLATIDLKTSEPCLRAFAEKYKLKYHTYTAAELNAVTGVFSKSDFVKGVTGVDNVCERAAVLAAGGELLLGKTVFNGMTLALAAPAWQCSFEDEHK